MPEILFYHLEKRSLDEALPGLVERTLARGWRALIRPDSAERAQAIDNLLWTGNAEAFLPHAQAGDGDAELQPVLITVETGNANHADVLFVVGGIMPAAGFEEAAGFARIVVLFDGRDGSALSAAREAWVCARKAGHDATYWKQSADGKWEKQA